MWKAIAVNTGKMRAVFFRMVVLVVLRVQSYDIFFNWQREMFISQAGMLAYHIAFYKSGEKRNEFSTGRSFLCESAEKELLLCFFSYQAKLLKMNKMPLVYRHIQYIQTEPSSISPGNISMIKCVFLYC